MKIISSLSNEAVKEAVRLKRKRHRYQRRRFLAEGEDLLDAALACGVVPRQVFLLEGHEGDVGDAGQRLSAAAPPAAGKDDRGGEARSSEPPTPRPSEPQIYRCSAAVMEKLSELGSGSRVIAVFEMIDSKFPGGFKFPVVQVKGPKETLLAGPVLYLAGVGDPGNAGTLIRAAAARRAAAAVLAPETADPYSSKALRATMGSLFQIPIFLDVGPDALIGWAQEHNMPLICADAHRGRAVWDADLSGGFVLALGSERAGLPQDLIDAAEIVQVPQTEETESINVAMAGTVILYEAMKQRLQ